MPRTVDLHIGCLEIYHYAQRNLQAMCHNWAQPTCVATEAPLLCSTATSARFGFSSLNIAAAMVTIFAATPLARSGQERHRDGKRVPGRRTPASTQKSHGDTITGLPGLLTCTCASAAGGGARRDPQNRRMKNDLRPDDPENHIPGSVI
jgi:hypothetical protein